MQSPDPAQNPNSLSELADHKRASAAIDAMETPTDKGYQFFLAHLDSVNVEGHRVGLSSGGLDETGSHYNGAINETVAQVRWCRV